MAKWVCNVCGYVHEGDTAPEACPVCKAPASKFTKQEEEMTWAAEHVVGVAKGAPEDIINDLIAICRIESVTDNNAEIKPFGQSCRNVLEAMFSSKNEVFLITGALTDTSKCAEIATMMSSARVLKYDTKTAIQKETASASEFTIVPADETLYSTTSGLYVRTGCSTSETVIGSLGYGESVKVTGRVQRNGADYGWVQVSYNSTTGYVYAGFLSSTKPEAAAQPAPEEHTEMVQCEYCGEWLETGNSYRNHMCPQKEAALAAEAEHDDPDMVQCEYCGEWLETGNSYRNHMCPEKEAALAAE